MKQNNIIKNYAEIVGVVFAIFKLRCAHTHNYSCATAIGKFHDVVRYTQMVLTVTHMDSEKTRSEKKHTRLRRQKISKYYSS